MHSLDLISLRILGVLFEKQKTTPDQYPLTLNALVNGCNQKSSRNPVLSLTNSDVGPLLSKLESDDWIRREFGSRAEKYSHRVKAKLDLPSDKIAILTVLMLRGPQTIGEIRTNCARLASFDSLDEVAKLVEELMILDDPFVELIPRRPGESADRYQQLFCPISDDELKQSPVAMPATSSKSGAVDERYDALERRIEVLEKIINDNGLS